jgi:hypothetical protein
MKKFVPGALAGFVVAAALAAPAYAGPTVTVRVEGDTATLLERTQVTLPDTGNDLCGGKAGTVAQALDIATAGNWDRQPFASTILGETPDFADNGAYWALWNGASGNYAFSSTEGVCDRVMSPGDEALLLVDHSPPPAYAPSMFPLAVRGLPVAVQAGVPVTVTVVRFALDGAASPVAGATVAGGGATATTDATGRATLRFPTPGAAVVKASAPGLVVSGAERVTVSATPVAPGAAGNGTGGTVVAGKDVTAPTATLAGLKRTYARGSGPRELRGTVSADPSGIKSVRLAVTRRAHGRCWTFAGGRERFVRHRCGGWKSFRIGDRVDWSYLLPRRLGPGRYTIRVIAIDKAGNDGATRARIRVR